MVCIMFHHIVRLWILVNDSYIGAGIIAFHNLSSIFTRARDFYLELLTQLAPYSMMHAILIGICIVMIFFLVQMFFSLLPWVHMKHSCEGRCLRSFHATSDAGADAYCESLGYSTAQVEVTF